MANFFSLYYLSVLQCWQCCCRYGRRGGASVRQTAEHGDQILLGLSAALSHEEGTWRVEQLLEINIKVLMKIASISAGVAAALESAFDIPRWFRHPGQVEGRL